MKILIVEDEKELSVSIATYLKGEDYVCETASDFNKAVEKIECYDYDCILLDITIPGGSGLNILKQLKANNKMDGVLIISARNSLDDKVNGLNLGADDYLPKPFHLSELSARLAAIIRRKKFNGNHLVKFNNVSYSEKAKPYIYLVSNKKMVISKNAIAEHLWGDEMEGNNDFIYTHIKNLRKKLVDAGEVDYIKSVYGMGYKFSD